jgi:glycerophosphoryl diester phosphodiesterase
VKRGTASAPTPFSPPFTLLLSKPLRNKRVSRNQTKANLSTQHNSTSTITILAHRGNLQGPSPLTENTIGAVATALGMGFGVETDLRPAGANRFYLDHDRQTWTPANDLDNFVKLFTQHPDSCIAVNVKELDDLSELISLQLSGRFGANSFYFDFELTRARSTWL